MLRIAEEGPNSQRIVALSQLTCLPPYADDLRRSKRLSEEALELARRFGERPSLFEALRSRLYSLSGPDSPPTAAVSCRHLRRSAGFCALALMVAITVELSVVRMQPIYATNALLSGCMPLDPQARQILDAMVQLQVPELSSLPAQAARELMAVHARAMPPGPEARVEPRELQCATRSIPVRIYRPLDAQLPSSPALIYFHGGGFVLGDLHGSDAICRTLATLTPCVVISVDYRLAPEHKFPAGLEDAYAASDWVAQHAAELSIDPARIAVAGDSAGGNLATVVSMLARERGGPRIAYQVLLYPVTDLLNFDGASYLENGEGLYLTRRTMLWFAKQYLSSGQSDALNGHVSPLLANDLRGLPPALVITAEFDPLRDEGEAYARRLVSAGVPTTLTRYAGMIHDFVRLSAYLDGGQRALAEVVGALQQVFASAE